MEVTTSCLAPNMPQNSKIYKLWLTFPILLYKSNMTVFFYYEQESNNFLPGTQQASVQIYTGIFIWVTLPFLFVLYSELVYAYKVN